MAIRAIMTKMVAAQGRRAEHTEGRPPVLHIVEVKKSRDDLPGLMEEEEALDNRFARLIQGKEKDEERPYDPVLSRHYPSPAMVCAQRWQISGCSLSLPDARVIDPATLTLRPLGPTDGY